MENFDPLFSMSGGFRFYKFTISENGRIFRAKRLILWVVTGELGWFGFIFGVGWEFEALGGRGASGFKMFRRSH